MYNLFALLACVVMALFWFKMMAAMSSLSAIDVMDARAHSLMFHVTTWTASSTAPFESGLLWDRRGMIVGLTIGVLILASSQIRRRGATWVATAALFFGPALYLCCVVMLPDRGNLIDYLKWLRLSITGPFYVSLSCALIVLFGLSSKRTES